MNYAIRRYIIFMVALCWASVLYSHPGHNHGNDDHAAETAVSTSQHESLMQARKAFSAVGYTQVGNSGHRYTMKYEGPDRYYKSVRFGLYPSVGKAQVHSVLTGWFYAGREYPVTFECKGVKRKSDEKLRLLLDRVER